MGRPLLADPDGSMPVMGSAVPPVRTSLRLVWLVGLVYAVAAATRPGVHGRHLAALILTVTTGLGWGAWLVSRHHPRAWMSYLGTALLAASGGALVVLHPIGVAVVGVAGMCATSLLEIAPAAVLTAPSVVAASIAVAVTGHAVVVIGNVASGAVAGLAIGMARRQAHQRTRRDAELALARERSDVEHDRAEVLAERNRIAREVHDVLAHTLSALAVQTEAMASLVDDDASQDEMRAVAQRSRRLVTEGLEETRRAVRVLRDEPVDAADQIRTLAVDAGARFELVGHARPLPPAAGLALVRTAQEALTNARKHAAGAAVAVSVCVGDTDVELVVDNARSTNASPLTSTGSGVGLQGMSERLELVGGSLTAGPQHDGWRVRAVVPT